MVGWLLATPGRLYVVATLLPLAAFVLLLVAGCLRGVCRPYRETLPLARFVYFFLGGSPPLRSGAYVATAAIAASAVLAIIGLTRFLEDAHSASVSSLELEQRWAERTMWAKVGPSGVDSAVALEIGYRVDHLTAVMFAMVAFVSTCIFVFSLGYM